MRPKTRTLLCVCIIFKKRLENEKLVALYETMDRPCVRVLYAMEHAGIKVCEKELKQLSTEFGEKLSALEKRFIKRRGKSLI